MAVTRQSPPCRPRGGAAWPAEASHPIIGADPDTSVGERVVRQPTCSGGCLSFSRAKVDCDLIASARRIGPQATKAAAVIGVAVTKPMTVIREKSPNKIRSHEPYP